MLPISYDYLRIIQDIVKWLAQCQTYMELPIKEKDYYVQKTRVLVSLPTVFPAAIVS